MTDDLYFTMRSLCRLTFMKDKNFPDILLKTEKQILNTRIKSLSEQDRNFINDNFKRYYDRFLIELETDDVILSNKINHEMKSWN